MEKRDTQSLTECVWEFHKVFGLPIIETPTLATQERFELRYSLIFEELCEFADAVKAEDLTAVADSLGDLLYVVIGAALEYGIPIDEVVEIIHTSNMSKLDVDGTPIYREDGKVLKGPNFLPPEDRIRNLLNGKI